MCYGTSYELECVRVVPSLFILDLPCVCMLMCVSDLSSSLHGWVRAQSGDDVITDVFLCSVPLRLSSWCFIHIQQSNLHLF